MHSEQLHRLYYAV